MNILSQFQINDWVFFELELNTIVRYMNNIRSACKISSNNLNVISKYSNILHTEFTTIIWNNYYKYLAKHFSSQIG